MPWSSIRSVREILIGFGDEVSAVAAFLQHFDDPRFFGGVQAMPVAEFRRKVRVADGEMVKSCPAVVFRKSARLESRLRRDGVRQRYLVRVDAGHPAAGGGLPAVPPDSSYITTLGEAEEYWKTHFESRNPATIKVRKGMRAYGIVVTFKRNHAYTQDELGTGRDDDRDFSVERAATMSHIWPTLHSPGAVRWSDTDPRKKAFYKELKIEHPKYGVVILEPTPTPADLKDGICSHYDFVSWHPLDNEKKGKWATSTPHGQITPFEVHKDQMKKATVMVTFSSPQIPSACAEGRLPVVVGFPFDQGGSFDPALHRYPSGSGGAHEARSNHTHRTEFIKSLPAGGAQPKEQHMEKIDMLKSHIDAYTRSDGTVVQAHEDARQKRSDNPAFMMKQKDSKHYTFHDHESGDELKDYQGYARHDSGGETTHFHTKIEPNGEWSFTSVGKNEAAEGGSAVGPHRVGDHVSYKGVRSASRTGKVKGTRDGKVVVEHKAGYTEPKHHSELSPAGGDW